MPQDELDAVVILGFHGDVLHDHLDVVPLGALCASPGRAPRTDVESSAPDLDKLLAHGTAMFA